MQGATNQPGASEASAIDARAEASSTPDGEPRNDLQEMSRLSHEERRKREAAVRFADASIELEGFTLSDEARARADRFIAGEIDLGEFLQVR